MPTGGRKSTITQNDVTPKGLVNDVKYQFGKVYYEELVKRRRKLFALMITSFVSVLIMFFIDGYMNLFLSRYNMVEAVITIIGRMI
jgi:hypothetical protein